METDFPILSQLKSDTHLNFWLVGFFGWLVPTWSQRDIGANSSQARQMFGEAWILFIASAGLMLLVARVVLVAVRERLVALLEVRILELRERDLAWSRTLEGLSEGRVRGKRRLTLKWKRGFYDFIELNEMFTESKPNKNYIWIFTVSWKGFLCYNHESELVIF